AFVDIEVVVAEMVDGGMKGQWLVVVVVSEYSGAGGKSSCEKENRGKKKSILPV
ncbi:hypothetical protein Tco_1529737, partial [Tanacetum coccineum]